MKRLALLLTTCSFFAMAGGSEKALVLKTLDSWNEGWKTRDVGLAIADYADDCDFTNAFGDRFEGKDQLKEGLTFIFSLDFVMAGDSESNAYQDVTFLSDSIAMIRSQLVRKDQKTDSGEVMKDRLINHLRVLEKREGRWLIVSHLVSQAKEKGSL